MCSAHSVPKHGEGPKHRSRIGRLMRASWDGARERTVPSQAENASSILVARSNKDSLYCLGFCPQRNHVAWSLSASFRHSSPRFSVAVVSQIIVRDTGDSDQRVIHLTRVTRLLVDEHRVRCSRVSSKVGRANRGR